MEHFNPWAKIRLDLFGFIDIVAIRSDVAPAVLAVQTTSGANITSHIPKSEELFIWLKAGNQFEVHGWRKMGKRGTQESCGK